MPGIYKPHVAMSHDYSQSLRRNESAKDKMDLETLISNNGKGGAFSTSDRVTDIVLSENNIERFENLSSGSSRLSEKTDAKINTIQSVSSLMSDFKDEIMRMRSSTQLPNNTFTVKMDSILDQLESTLNNVPSFSGRSEIYNSRTVDFSLLTGAPDAAIADHSYCLGCKTGTNLHIDDSKSFWDVSALTAGDHMFEEFIRAIRVAKTGNPADKADQTFTDALGLVNGALDKADEALQTTGFLKKTIDQRVKMLTDKKLDTQEFYESISRDDISELYIQSAVNEDNLESLYHLFVRDEKNLQAYRSLISKII